MKLSFVTLALGLAAGLGLVSSQYCLPDDSCWPSNAEWRVLNSALDGRLVPLFESEYGRCFDYGTDARQLGADSLCMQGHSCRLEECVVGNPPNHAAYAVEARSVGDVELAMQFAIAYDLQVSVKTTGHSYQGTSTQKGSLLIWTSDLPRLSSSGRIVNNYADSCGTDYPEVIRAGGGETWEEVYAAVGLNNHIAGGGGLTVGAAGGWLQGVGLSAMSRRYGAGIDNVLDYDVVLPNGTRATVDACSDGELFFALRGGGGGTFGVVVGVTYRLYPVEPVTLAVFSVTNPAYGNSFIDFWVDESPVLDRDWNGYWGVDFLLLYYIGNANAAEVEAQPFVQALIADMEAWMLANGVDQRPGDLTLLSFPSGYYQSRVNGETDPTGYLDLALGSWLVPREYALRNGGADAKALIKELRDSGATALSYFLGGAMTDPLVEDTAVHPAMRTALWQINVISEANMNILRQRVPSGGPGFNHHSKFEDPLTLWGDSNRYDTLLAIKNRVDSAGRLNCFHCVGFRDVSYTYNEADITYSPNAASTPSARVALFGMLIALLLLFT